MLVERVNNYLENIPQNDIHSVSSNSSGGRSNTNVTLDMLVDFLKNASDHFNYNENNFESNLNLSKVN